MTQPTEFNYEIKGQPDFSYLTVHLEAGQTIKAEASAMTSMDTNISMATKFKGGFKRFFGGESIFINEFTADQFAGQLTLAGGVMGDIVPVHLDNQTIFIQSGGFLASGMGIQVDTKWQGMIKGFFSGAGLFLLKCSGKGDVFMSTFGGLIPIEVNGDYVVDNNHLVAFTEGLEYNITKVAGYKSFFFSGEGLVTRFTGQGRVWVQTHQYPAFASWIWPFRPQRNSN